MQQKILSSLFLGVILVLSGCSAIENSHRHKKPMMQEYTFGNNSKVSEFISEKLNKEKWNNVVGTGDEIMWRLEAGSLNFHLANYKEAVEQFKIAEELINAYDERALISVRDVSAEAGAALSNMNALPYRGYCRDRILLSFFKSLAYLGVGRESAFRAQLRRLRNEHKKVQDDYRAFFDAEKAELNKAKAANAQVAQEKNPDMSPEQLAADPKNAAWATELKQITAKAHKGYGNFLNPATIFLSSLGSILDGNYENARIDIKRLYEAVPNNPVARRYYVSVLKKTGCFIPAELKRVKPYNFDLARDCVYVIFANGRSAAFKQISIYFPIMTAWPVMEFYPPRYTSLHVTADGQKHKAFPIADMDAIMAQEYKDRLPGIITRVILSTAIKEAAYYAALAAANQISDATARAVALISVAAAGTAYRVATNTADTRSWEILPKEFQLTLFPTPRNKTISINLGGLFPKTANLRIPDDAGAAIIYISAVNENNIRYHIFPFK